MSGSAHSYMPDLLNRPGGILGTSADNPLDNYNGPTRMQGSGYTGGDNTVMAGKEIFPTDAMDSSTRHPDTQGKSSNTLDYNGKKVDPALNENVHPASEINPNAVQAGKELFDPSDLEGPPARHPDRQGRDEPKHTGLGTVTPLPEGTNTITSGGDKVIAGKEVFAADNLSDSTTRHPDTQGRKSNTLDYNGPAVQTAGKSNVHSANTVDPHAVRGGKELFDPSVTEGASARHPDTQKDLTDTTQRMSIGSEGHEAKQGTTVVKDPQTGLSQIVSTEGDEASGSHETGGKKKGGFMKKIKAIVKPDVM